MKTGSITVKNGQVIGSICKGLIIYSGAIVDGIRLNGVEYRRSDGGSARTFAFGPDEIVEELRYRKASRYYINSLCYLVIITNFDTYQVDGFAEWEAGDSQRGGYCATQQYSVQIPSDQNFAAFLDSNILYDAVSITGFNGENELNPTQPTSKKTYDFGNSRA